VPKVIISLYVIATSFALVALKYGSKAGAPIHYVDNKLQFNINLYTVLGIALYGISFLIYMYLISKYDLGYIIPLTAAFIYILIFVASYFIFHELFTTTKIMGIGLIIVGLAFLNFKK
jgi:drug/metabolite transporter (DMT)-like permease